MLKIKPKEMMKFLRKNHWEIINASKHNKIRFKEDVILGDGTVKSTGAKLIVNFHREYISEEQIKEIKEAFEIILNLDRPFNKNDFVDIIKKCKRIINIT